MVTEHTCDHAYYLAKENRTRTTLNPKSDYTNPLFVDPSLKDVWDQYFGDLSREQLSIFDGVSRWRCHDGTMVTRIIIRSFFNERMEFFIRDI